MAILALPLVISFLKPHSTHFYLLRPGKPNPSRLYKAPLSKRFFYRTSAVSTSTVPSTGSNSETQKASVLTFQQAIQRLQVILLNLIVCLLIIDYCLLISFMFLDPCIFLKKIFRNIGLRLDVL